MNYIKHISLLAAVALAFSLAALAKDTQSGNFTVDTTVEVGATQLAPGTYRAEWSGPANAVKIDIIQKGKTVATTDGQIKSLQKPSPYDAVIVKPAANNQKTIGEIDFNHRTEALVIGGE